MGSSKNDFFWPAGATGLPFVSKPLFAAVVCAEAFMPGTAWFEAAPAGCGGGALALGAVAFGAEPGGGATPTEGGNAQPSPPVPGGGGSGGPARPQPATPNATAPSIKAPIQTRKRLCAKKCSPSFRKRPTIADRIAAATF